MWCGVGGCGRVWGNAQCALDYILLSSSFGKVSTTISIGSQSSCFGGFWALD